MKQVIKPKPKQRNLSSEDHINLLKLLAVKEIPEIATELKISQGAVRGRIQRLRDYIDKQQSFLNQVRALQRQSRRVRKFTTKGSVPESDTLEDEIF